MPSAWRMKRWRRGIMMGGRSGQAAASRPSGLAPPRPAAPVDVVVLGAGARQGRAAASVATLVDWQASWRAAVTIVAAVPLHWRAAACTWLRCWCGCCCWCGVHAPPALLVQQLPSHGSGASRRQRRRCFHWHCWSWVAACTRCGDRGRCSSRRVSCAVARESSCAALPPGSAVITVTEVPLPICPPPEAALSAEFRAEFNEGIRHNLAASVSVKRVRGGDHMPGQGRWVDEGGVGGTVTSGVATTTRMMMRRRRRRHGAPLSSRAQ